MALDKILVVGKEAETHDLARPFAKQLFAADNVENIWETIDHVEPHMILVCKSANKKDVCGLLAEATSRKTKTPIVVAGQCKEDHSETMLNLGAYDYLNGAKDYKRLGLIIDNITAGRKPNTSQKNY